MTQEQLDQLSGMLVPLVKDLLNLTPERDLSIRISLSAIPMVPSSAHMLVVSILLDGKDLRADQEAKVTEFLKSVDRTSFIRLRRAKA